MKKNYAISKFCHVRDSGILLNGQEVFSSGPSEYAPFIKTAYRHLGIQYSKFFKMDALSKLAFVAAYVILRDEGAADKRNIDLVFSNKASSLHTDRKHWESMGDVENYYPSPALFVYTLPNICLGEISIYHKLYSENSFFIFERFNPVYLHGYANALMDGKTAEKVLCGWVDVDGDKSEAFLYLVEREGSWAHTPTELERLYDTNGSIKNGT
ncbi:MAG: 3-oxoacyl-ACP synthase [Flavobacteriaceae bacterium]